MPNPTFFNLPEQKRLSVIHVALKEFAQHGYANASLTRIVEQAGIAKGSIYQYFQDKQDLYLYLLELALQEKQTYLRQEMSFFPYLRWLFGIHLAFETQHPNLSSLLKQATHSELPFDDEKLQRIRQASPRYIWQLVRQGVAQGDIRTKNSRLTAFIVNSVMEKLSDFVMGKTGIGSDSTEFVSLKEVDPRTVDKLLDDLVLMLELGVSNYTRKRVDSDEELKSEEDTKNQEITTSLITYQPQSNGLSDLNLVDDSKLQNFDR
ncbi:TetR/AcrR family transcriptional regulator [Thermostichus vulcanus]|uniref:TetR/AcrR family transcriptional regulator n=1 Tax=Thermostichus vulcanus str. 'Rupite' TaxID=2813851 RepID=A0ABT0CEF5_THEVL|nr:TetR/AcrR family transcriptional regulator [Thermostichus vulcanus]MCJ2544109.1 TetR/AcrR family transcriptional regulator [Thermostichus vulcanus str. 'Rupite']